MREKNKSVRLQYFPPRVEVLKLSTESVMGNTMLAVSDAKMQDLPDAEIITDDDE
ncbi:hypothetical protein [Prevotella melaninogenica]|uniref:hypothetical protein n=1 Tax=Prevotella melaninogenica TaxID=28132 RepID=UPI0012E0992D|nr:hypothetical protein [Prevotella melaninogenica]